MASYTASRKRTIIIVIVGIIVLVAIITPIAYFAEREKKDSNDAARGGGETPPREAGLIDCFPETRSAFVRPTREECEHRGCVYDEKSITSGKGFKCYFPVTGGLHYSVASKEDTDHGFKLRLARSGWGPFGMDFRRPTLDVQMLSNDLIRFTFDDDYATPARYRVPIETNLPATGADNPKYEFKITDESTFSFQIIRNSTGTVIFDTGVGGLVLSDQFLQLVTRLPSDNVYGMGENSHDSFKHQFGRSWPAFSRDQPPGWEGNLYGVHPFYTCVEDKMGNTHGVFILNSNAQEYALASDPNRLTFRTIGGVLDVYVFLGPSPENVVQQYTQLIGRPVMPPYWALGFQLCRYGYNSLDNLKRAVNETLAYDIPLDVQYADIDHMDERKIFTVDNVNFSGLNDYFKSLQANGMHTIIILDPCIISNETDYEPYETMKAVKGNIQWPSDFPAPEGSADTDNSMFGFVWPKGKVVFPDYFKNATAEKWKTLIEQHSMNMSFDGLWIDMNEPANFGTNEERPWNWPPDAKPYWSLHCGNNTWDDPPYRPLAAYLYDGPDQKKLISDKTLCMNGVQGEQGEYRHYDVHSLYGWSQTPSTLEAVRMVTSQRSIVITRSTFPSSGKYAGHWLGDNTSKWSHLAQSIIGMLEFNLFGIPYIGADICGFFENTTEELCLRWMQLGAFYPFSRNHNGLGYIEQHPGAFGDRVANASREILETRYWLLPYLYTLFHYAHTNGDTVVRPLHHEFAADETTRSIDRQFLWGPALLISPILEQGQTELSYYVPEGRWYQFYTDKIITGPSQEKVPVTMMSKPELHLRGGHILVLQKPANNTVYSRKNPFTIKVMLSARDTDGGEARGTLFWDDGDSVDTYENDAYFYVNYTASGVTRRLNIQVVSSGSDVADLVYEKIVIHGASAGNAVTITDDNTRADVTGNTVPVFNQNLQKLDIVPVSLTVSHSYTIVWS
ncbi:hypothetical protein BaRGS_00007571 [Batillaria attramentaria]|uniref:Alpha-glucosidase n=1 Tax=Batillaria attramentaria TaxID=370345 RepID=A0ABD0LNR1_9CAEN